MASARHNERVGVLVKYKFQGPRTRGFVGSAVKAWLAKGSDKVGVVLEVRHGLAVGENVAEAAVLLSRHGRLHYLHLNDKSRAWDDNRMDGSVHLVEYLELAYWLKTLDYKC